LEENGDADVQFTQVGDDRDEVRLAQPHPGMFAQGPADQLLIVLADRGDEHALRPDLLDHALEGQECLAPVAVANLDPLDAVIAEHPAPEGVVEIKHQALPES
jgi:hypothetical protein